jgi:hypothetical protein
MVKVQDDNVRFSAVDTRMLAKICTYSFPGSRNSPLPRLAARVAEAILGLQVVRGVVFLLAGLASSVTAIPLSVVDWNAIKRLDLLAFAALLGFHASSISGRSLGTLITCRMVRAGCSAS